MSEYSLCPEIVGKEGGQKTTYEWIAKNWKEKKAVEKGVRLKILPLSFEGTDLIMKRIKEGVPALDKYNAWKKELGSEYNKPRIRLSKLLAVKNPFSRPNIPYFRQIWFGDGHIIVANNFGAYNEGVIKIEGRPKRLAGIVRQIYEQKGKKYSRFVSNITHFCELLSEGGLLKIMDGFYFVVNGNFGREVFEFGSSPVVLEKMVLRRLEEKPAGRAKRG